MTHRLAALWRDTAGGAFPDPDGAVEVLGAPPGRCDAVVAFTWHHVVAAGVDAAEVRARLPADDPAAVMRPGFLAWLGERLGSVPGFLDAVLVAPPASGSPLALERRKDLDAHPRISRALRYRDDVEVYSDAADRVVLSLGRGLAGRLEVNVEVDGEHRGRGLGRAAIEAARALAGEPLFAQVSPGNVRSLRAFLACEFTPVAAEVLFPRA